MKLTKVWVRHFKSVRDSNPFKIDQKVTCLVGKNESGKTALLQAIAKVNPLDAKFAAFDFDKEYPRAAWDETRREQREVALTTTWKLDERDIARVAETLGPSAISADSVLTVEQGYFDGRRLDIAVAEPAVVAWLIEQHPMRAETRHAIGDVETVQALHDALKTVTERAASEEELLTFITQNLPGCNPKQTAARVLEPLLPKMVYIPDYFRMSGQISVPDLKNRLATNTPGPPTEGQRVFVALLDMVNATVDSLESEREFERLIAKLETASNTVGRRIFEYWSQNRHLKVQVRIDHARAGDPPPFNQGWIVRTRVENTRHGASLSFDERSAGFVWFFSFLVWFSQVKKNYGENLVILLDEPGLSLHAKAQADLLRYFEEKLAPHYQVIYSTHSPFMIDPEHLMRARTVEDIYYEAKPGEPPVPEDKLGTKVGDEVFSTDRDTVFPLQAALGYEITQSLFAGKHTLLVEGPSEILYLKWFSRRLLAEGRVGLDRRWTLSPCGGVDKVPAFISLFAGSDLDLAVLTDFAEGQKKKVRDLRESKLLKDGRVFTADAYAGQAEADIEDLVGREMYRDLVARAYGLDPAHHMPETRPTAASIRVVKEAEQHFAVLPPNVPEFDHFAPSSFLIEQGPTVTFPGLDAALARFERLFADLNAVLPVA